MLLIKCPWCGRRDESEFSYGGEGGIVRPADPDVLTDEEWADYLFMRKNSKGLLSEQWNHAQGCRRWFNAERHTVTYRITKTWKIGEIADSADPADSTGQLD